MLQLPIYWGFMFVQQNFVCLGKVPASEEGATRKRAGMRGLQHEVPGSVDESLLAASEIPPQHKHYSIAII
jgi:hypothetical protein